MSKIFIFDRDDTLLNQFYLINEKEILSILRTIDEHSTTQWAIASAEPAEKLADDGAYHEICKKITNLNMNEKKTFYSTICQKAYLERLWDLDITFEPEVNEILESKKNALEYILNEKTYKNEFVLDDVQCALADDALVKFNIGNTAITFKLAEFYKNREILGAGRWKFFKIIDILDQAGKTLNIENSGLERLGVTLIENSKSHELIEPCDVIFCDDDANSFKMGENVGFTSILADTKEHSRRYLHRLEQEIAPLRVNNLKRKIIEGIKNGNFTGLKKIKIEDNENNLKTYSVANGILSILKVLDSSERSDAQKLEEVKLLCSQKHDAIFSKKSFLRLNYRFNKAEDFYEEGSQMQTSSSFPQAQDKPNQNPGLGTL